VCAGVHVASELVLTPGATTIEQNEARQEGIKEIISRSQFRTMKPLLPFYGIFEVLPLLCMLYGIRFSFLPYVIIFRHGAREN